MRDGRKYLKPPSRYPDEDIAKICLQISNHLPIRRDVTEATLRDLVEKTRKYFFDTVISQLLDRYVLAFHSLSEHMF